MLSYFFLLCFLVSSGFCIGYNDLSFFWGIIPVIIGSFWGCWNSRFTKMLLVPGTDQAMREKLMQTLRVLGVMWAVTSVMFVAAGYALPVFIAAK